MLDLRLAFAQRIAALIMAPLVLGHIAVMIWAVEGGLTAAEILGRTRGSLFWGAYYGLFVIAVSVHAGIGLRVIAHEWFGLRPRWLAAFAWAVGIALAGLGLRAVVAVTWP